MKYASWPLIITMSLLFASEVFASGIRYVAPKSGGPSLRVDPNYRHTCSNFKLSPEFKLDVLAPERLAYTIDAQPKLYWRVNQEITDGTFALTIEEARPGFLFPEPLVDLFLEQQEVKPGDYNIFSLADLGTRLEKNVNYKWTVTLVCDREKRSLDIGQTGMVRYVNKPKGMKSTDLSKLARKGVWYDVFEKANSDQRKALLQQIGLEKIEE